MKAPHSFVINRGPVGKYLQQMIKDFRSVLEPFTASKLKVTRKNVLKDFVSIASYLNVTHVAIITRTEKAPYFRLCRMPRGPTITYRLVEYTLRQDVVRAQRKQHVNASLFQAAPLLILNGFGSGEDDIKSKLETSMWRNLFPSINLKKVELAKVKRCVLLNYDAETDMVEFRHYAIKVKPVGLSKTVKKLLTGKKVPDLGNYRSVEEAIEKGDLAAFTESECEGDDDERTQVTVSQKLSSRANLVNEKSSIRLVELGPRMKLQLMKIEEGLMEGEVLHHSFIKKTPQEVSELKQRAEERARLKLARKQQQEANVRKKLEEEKKRKIEAGEIDEEDAEEDDNSKAKKGDKNNKFKKKKKKSADDDEDGEVELVSLEQTATNKSKTKRTKVEPDNHKLDRFDGDEDEDDFDDYKLSDDELMPIDDAEDD